MHTYATLLSSNNYLLGVLTLKRSLDIVNSQFPFLVLVTNEVAKPVINRMLKAGITVRKTGDSFPVPANVMADIPVDRWRLCFDKLRFFGMTDYKKIIYLDADMLVLRNIDHLFEKPHLSAVTAYGFLKGFEQWSFPNAGFWVIEPSAELDESIWSVWPQVYETSGNVNDQTLIYEYWREKWANTSDWRLPNTYNCFVYLIDRFINEKGFNLDIASPNDKTIAILHFATRFRPWLMSWPERQVYVIRKLLSNKPAELKVYRLYRKILRSIKKDAS